MSEEPKRFRVEVDSEPAMASFRRAVEALEKLLDYLQNPDYKITPLEEEQK